MCACRQRLPLGVNTRQCFDDDEEDGGWWVSMQEWGRWWRRLAMVWLVVCVWFLVRGESTKNKEESKNVNVS
jgi:hypothetical protein